MSLGSSVCHTTKRLHLTHTRTNTSTVRKFRQTRVLAGVPLSGIAARHVEVSQWRKSRVGYCSLVTLSPGSTVHSTRPCHTSPSRTSDQPRGSGTHTIPSRTPGGARSPLWVRVPSSCARLSGATTSCNTHKKNKAHAPWMTGRLLANTVVATGHNCVC